ncbi:MAG: cysteine desulfurase family protein [Lentimonas sp.]
MDLHSYFDNNATTPLCPEAKTAWCEAIDGSWLNPSSPYRAAAQVHVRLEAVRDSLAVLLGADASRVLFNSGATEGNNLVFAHWVKALPANLRIAVSPTEHPSVIEAAKFYFAERITWLALDDSGVVDLDALREQLASGEFAAVSAMAANNETGVLNPWREIAAACSEFDCDYHCDASQWIGKMPLDGLSACDYVTACAHKFGGPRGVGFLIHPVNAQFSSLLGGTQQAGRRAGTEDVAGVLAMFAALEVALVASREASVAPRDQFFKNLQSSISEVELIGADAMRLWNTVSIIMPEFASERWIRALEKRGYFVSSGSACSTGKDGPSHVLTAMNVDAVAMRRVLRVSASAATTEADWGNLLGTVCAVYAQFKADAGDSTSRVISI